MLSKLQAAATTTTGSPAATRSTATLAQLLLAAAEAPGGQGTAQPCLSAAGHLRGQESLALVGIVTTKQVNAVTNPLRPLRCTTADSTTRRRCRPLLGGPAAGRASQPVLVNGQVLCSVLVSSTHCSSTS